MSNSMIKPYVMFVLFVQVSFIIIAPTHIFPSDMGLSSVDAWDSITDNIDAMRSTISNASGWEYAVLLPGLIVNAGIALFSLIDLATSGIPDLMHLLSFPDILCDAIQVPVGALMLYEIIMFFRTGDL